MHEFVADATLRLEFVKKVQAKIAENDPKFLSFEISILFLLVLFLVLVLISMCISVREGEATKLKLVPSTSGSNRALSPMPKAAQANNHIDKKRSAIGPRNNLVPIAIRTEAPVNEEINGTIIFIYLLCFCFIPICYHLHFSSQSLYCTLSRSIKFRCSSCCWYCWCWGSAMDF
jgi:hypothetical protein